MFIESVITDSINISLNGCYDTTSVIVNITNTGQGWLIVKHTCSMSGVTFGSDSVIISPGSSGIIRVYFDASTQLAGIYSGVLNLFSNDTLHPLWIVPVTMIESGWPYINTSNWQIDFSSITQNTDETILTYIYNFGCDTLHVSNLVSLRPEYTFFPTSFDILPQYTQEVSVNFHPLSAGNFDDTLTILSNNVQTYQIALLATANPAPVINLSTDSIEVTITESYDSVSVPLMVHNIGSNDLEFHMIQPADFFDDFENGLGKWTYTGQWSTSSDAYAGTHSLSQSPGTFYTNSMNQWMGLKDSLVVTRPDSCQLQFWLKKILSTMGDYLEIYLQVNGSSWTMFETVYYDEDWTLTTYNLSSYVTQGSYIKIFLHFQSDWGGVSYGVKLDDLKITGIGPDGPWLSIAPVTGIISPGDSSIINLTFKSAGMDNGVHSQLVRVVSDDMVRPNLPLPCIFHVQGSAGPIMELSPGNLFADIYGCNDSVSVPITIHNNGLAVLQWQFNSTNVSDTDGTTQPGDSSLVQVNFFSASLVGGSYSLPLQLSTNDPLHAWVEIPATVIVHGVPELHVPVFCEDFGTIMQYTSKTDTIIISNTGCDTLHISGLEINLPAFSVTASSLKVAPSSTGRLMANFHPVSTGTFTDSLKITSNDGSKSICLTGTASGIPLVSIFPDTIYDEFLCQVTGSKTLRIKNLGAIPLNYSFQMQNAPWLQITPVSGTLSSGDSATHMLSYSKAGLAAGSYHGNIIINSNDPLHAVSEVPFEFHVTDPYRPVDLGEDQYLCAVASADLHAGEDYASYLWNSGSSDPDLSVSTSGNYSVTITDDFGCIYSDTVSIQFYNNPIVFAGNDSIACAGTGFVFQPQCQNLTPTVTKTFYLGSGTDFTSDVEYTPFGTFYMDHRMQMIYTASELAASGLSAGNITSLSFNVGTTGSPAMQGFSIKIGQTFNTTLTGPVNGLTTTFSSNAYSPVSGWNTFNFSQEFGWNGYQSLVVEVCFHNTSWEESSSVQYSIIPHSVWTGWVDNCYPQCGCDLTIGNVFNRRANIRLSGTGNVTKYAWTGPGDYSSNLRNAVVHPVTYASAGTYVLTVDNGIGCLGTDTVEITVNPIPVVEAGSNQTIVCGNSVSLNATVNGGAGPYTCQWTPVTGLSDATVPDPLASPTQTTTYAIRATGANACYALDSLTINIIPVFSINGIVSYKNTQISPLGNVKIDLKDPGGTVIDSIVTNGDGSYHFDSLVSGNYSYQISSAGPFGGVNATDALLVSKHVVSLVNLKGLNLTAADVNNNGAVSSADALLIMRRTVGFINNFPAGNWIFDYNPMVVSGSNLTQNVKGLCVGDVNGSLIPGAKTVALLTLEESGLAQLQEGKVIEIPVSISDACRLGAMTLALALSDDILKVTDVKSSIQGLIWNVLPDHKLKIAWQNTEGIDIQENEVIATLKVNLKNTIALKDPLVRLLDGSEFADPDARVIQAKLTIPAVGKRFSSGEISLEIQPNPFSDQTRLICSIPAEAWVRISIIDIYGKQQRKIYDAMAQRGPLVIDYRDTEVPPGLFTVFITVEANGSYYTLAAKVVKTH
jgi:hypothetical protein